MAFRARSLRQDNFDRLMETLWTIKSITPVYAQCVAVGGGDSSIETIMRERRDQALQLAKHLGVEDNPILVRKLGTLLVEFENFETEDLIRLLQKLPDTPPHLGDFKNRLVKLRNPNMLRWLILNKVIARDVAPEQRMHECKMLETLAGKIADAVYEAQKPLTADNKRSIQFFVTNMVLKMRAILGDMPDADFSKTVCRLYQSSGIPLDHRTIAGEMASPDTMGEQQHPGSARSSTPG